MQTGIRRRVSFPNKLAGEPGPSLLFATWLKKEHINHPFNYFLKKKQEFKGLELICADVDCEEPKSLANYSCTADFEGGVCGAHPLKLQADVIEDEGIERIKPSTLRIWCPRGHSLYNKSFNARCEKDGGRLKYFLVGNEKDEFLLYAILEISQGLDYKTTTYYQAALSCGGNVGKALNWLTKKNFMERKELDLVYKKWINEPHAYKITSQGIEKYHELKKILSPWLYQEFSRLLYARGGNFWKIREPQEQKVKRYETLIRQLKINQLPRETLDKICAELGTKPRGIKKLLASKLKQDVGGHTQTVYPILENIYNNPGRITIERNGCVYRFNIPNLMKNKETTTITHIPSGYLPQIYEADMKYVDWSLADKL